MASQMYLNILIVLRLNVFPSKSQISEQMPNLYFFGKHNAALPYWQCQVLQSSEFQFSRWNYVFADNTVKFRFIFTQQFH